MVMQQDSHRELPWIAVMRTVVRYGSVLVVFIGYFDQPQLPWPRMTSVLLLVWALLAAFQDQVDTTRQQWLALEALGAMDVFVLGLLVHDAGWFWILFLVSAFHVGLVVPIRRGAWFLGFLFLLRLIDLLSIRDLTWAVTVQALVTTVWLLLILSGVGYVLARQIEEKQDLENLTQALDRSHRQLTDAYHQLAVYSARIEETAALNERTRIAREMHDALGHTMVGLTIQLEAANRLLTRDTERAQAHLQQALELAKAATLEVRHAVRALRPPKLIRGQLTFAVARLVDDFQALTGVNVELIVGSGGYELSDASEIAIYRGVQEALTNAHNHGQATRVVVHLKSGARGVAVRIKDDGRGTDGLLSEMAGLGLEGIRHRVRDAGGIVRFRSRLQAGFVVLMVLPRGGAD